MYTVLAVVALLGALCTFAYADYLKRRERRGSNFRRPGHPFRRRIRDLSDAELRAEFYDCDAENKENDK